MRPLSDASGITGGGLARLAGGLLGFGLVLAAALPFDGVPPRGGSGAPVPAQLEVHLVGTAQLLIEPLGLVMKPTEFPAPGAPGGPSLAISVRNITATPVKLSIRFVGIGASLDTAVKVRGSVAGAVIVNGPLGKAADWSRPAGVLRSGATTTLRVRFKLLPGTPPDQWRGHLDVRQLEFKVVPAGPAAAAIPDGTTPAATTPDDTTPANTPATTTPAATSPVATTPAVTPTSVPTGGITP